MTPHHLLPVEDVEKVPDEPNNGLPHVSDNHCKFAQSLHIKLKTYLFNHAFLT